MSKVFIVSGTSWGGVSLDARYKPKRKSAAAGDALRGVKLKIKRASQHIQEIEKLLGEFRDSHRIVCELDSDGIKEHMKIILGEIPEMLSVAIGETLYHLRSALDHLTASLPNAAKRVQFPIDTYRNSESLKRKINALPRAARPIVRRLKPYKRGNPLLWAMNILRNRDIHHNLIPVVPHKLSWSPAGRVHYGKNTIVEIVYQYSQTFKKEIHLLTTLHGAKIEPDTKPEIPIAFNEPRIKVIQGQPVLAVLQQFVTLTQRIVDIFENRFFPAL